MNFDCHCGWEGDHFGAAEHSKDTGHDPLGMGAHGGAFWSELVDAHRRDLMDGPRLTIREKAKARDGNGPWLFPKPGVFFTVENFGWPSEHVVAHGPNEEDDPETTHGGWYD